MDFSVGSFFFFNRFHIYTPVWDETEFEMSTNEIDLRRKSG